MCLSFNLEKSLYNLSKYSEFSQISSIFPTFNLLSNANYGIYTLHNKAWKVTAVPLVSKIVLSMNSSTVKLQAVDSLLVAHSRIFWLLMKGKFDTYVCDLRPKEFKIE